MPELESKTIPYADALTQWGVSFQQSRYALRVVVPPLGSWRQLPRGYIFSIPILLALAGLPICLDYSGKGRLTADAVPGVIAPGGSAILVTLFAARLLLSRTVIDVTGEELVVTSIGMFGLGTRLRWPRLRVTEIKRNVSNDKLLIRAEGFEMTDVRLGNSRELVDAVVRYVRKAVFETEFLPASPADALPVPATILSTGHVASACVAIAAVCFASGVALLCSGVCAGGGLILAGFVLLMAAAGIAHGVWEREYFT